MNLNKIVTTQFGTKTIAEQIKEMNLTEDNFNEYTEELFIDYCNHLVEIPKEQLHYPTPQVISVFVPNFTTRKIKIRQLILSDDWVADCYELDEKYGIWFTTIEKAQEILKVPVVTEI